MASKSLELKIAFTNLPIGCGENELTAELQSMLQREYADGVQVSVSILQPPKPSKAEKAEKAA